MQAIAVIAVIPEAVAIRSVMPATHDWRAAADGDRMITLRDGRSIDAVKGPTHQVALQIEIADAGRRRALGDWETYPIISPLSEIACLSFHL